MKEIIRISECWETADIGFVSTFVELNRATNEVLSVAYHWHKNMSLDNKAKVFDSFESLNTFIDELVDARNEERPNTSL